MVPLRHPAIHLVLFAILAAATAVFADGNVRVYGLGAVCFVIAEALLWMATRWQTALRGRLAEEERNRAAVEKLANHNAELSGLLWRTVDRLQLVASIDQDFAERTLDLDRLVNAIATRTCEALGDAVGVYLREEHHGSLRTLEARAPADPERVRPLFASSSATGEPTLVRLAIRTARAHVYADLVATASHLGTEEERAACAGDHGMKPAMVVPIRSRAGDPTGAILLMRAASAPPYTQDDVELVEQVADRASVAIENARLYRARESFLGLAAHELRTPTTALRAQAQLLLRRLDAMPPEKVRSGLENIERQTGRLARLINDLLDVTRIDAAKLELRTEPVDAGELAADLIERFEQVTSRSCFRREGEEHLWVQADSARLDQVLSNLLTNAVKFCQDGDIVLRAERQDGEVILSVVDHGPGIPKEKQALLFERFSQLGSDGDRRGGLGLGLYLSRELVLRMGGRIWIESDGVAGHQTAFRVALPGASAPEARASA